MRTSPTVKWNSLALLLGIFFSIAIPAYADEVANAHEQLQQIAEQLNYVRKTGLHLQDEGRIYILQKVVSDVDASIAEKGLGNLRTLNLYQQLIVKFRFSTQFFEFVRTISTEKQITSMLALVNKIREERGFDDDPYSKILKSNLEQMFSSLTLVARMDSTPADIKKRIQSLTPAFGAAIALADQGDRPKAFARSVEIYKTLKDMYGALQSLSASPDAFRYVLEVMGLNEFIAEYSQLDRT